MPNNTWNKPIPKPRYSVMRNMLDRLPPAPAAQSSNEPTHVSSCDFRPSTPPPSYLEALSLPNYTQPSSSKKGYPSNSSSDCSTSNWHLGAPRNGRY
ncbi:hypothetical protein [Wolbachia endosymbiont of Pentidionis agamae]|uniref:hypothetical protein n=1 Tax=Wolbachia endosymbiont of Pentidionis agamae TaxID=3110435 RepID=UPI002FD559C1